MKKIIRGKIGTILILVVTLILAGVAIFTAIRLYQLGSQPVAPNVPSSIPKAAENNTCSLTFTVGTPPACIPQTFVSGSITDGGSGTTNVSCDFGKAIDCIMATVKINGVDTNCTYKSNNGTASVFSCAIAYTAGMQASCNTFTDVTVPSSKSNCCSSGNIVTAPTPVPQCSDNCAVDTDCPSGLTCYQPPKATCAPGTECSDLVLHKVCRNLLCQDSTTCTCPTPTPTVTPTATPTATPGPTGTPNSCGGTCGSNINCNGGLFCYQGFCRNPSCQDQSSCNCPGPTGTPNNCGGTCGSNINCNGGLFCYQGFCRNPSCQDQSSCSCPGTVGPTSTPKVATPTLPSSGTDWPTLMGAGIGILVVIGSLLLAL